MEQEKEEEQKRLHLEKEKKEQEEFDQWKNMFEIEEKGHSVILEEEKEEANQSLLQRFIDYIQSNKVIILEDLASEFGLTTQDTIDRVNRLQENGRITGIVDDRGKFIYISEEEMEKVAKYIQRKGRLTIHELSKECNQLIQLDTTTTTTTTITTTSSSNSNSNSNSNSSMNTSTDQNTSLLWLEEEEKEEEKEVKTLS
jgi:hypothetical protein